MNDVILIYSDDFKKLDFGYGHLISNGKLLNTLVSLWAQVKIISADRYYASILSPRHIVGGLQLSPAAR